MRNLQLFGEVDFYCWVVDRLKDIDQTIPIGIDWSLN